MSRASATIDILANDKKFAAAMKRVTTVMLRVRDRMEAVSKTARNMLLVSAGAMAGILKAASDYEETLSKFRTVFKTASADVEEWVDVNSNAMNRGRTAMMGYLATLQDTFVPFGFARDKAAELSKTITTLGIDLASFNNMADSDVIQNLTSALVGNHEAVRKFGVLITENTLKAELMSMGIKGGTKAATEQQKVMARVNLIFKSTSDAQGDATRTAGSFENQLKGLKSAVTDLAVTLGQAFIPAMTEFVSQVKEILPRLREWSQENASLIVSIVKWTASLAAILVIVPKIIGFGSSLITAISGIRVAIVALLPVIAALKASMLALAATPLGAVIAAVALLTAGIAYAVIEIRKLNAELDALSARSTSAAKGFTELKEARAALKDANDTESQVKALQKVLDAQQKLQAHHEREYDILKAKGTEFSVQADAAFHYATKFKDMANETAKALGEVTAKFEEQQAAIAKEEELRIAQEAISDEVGKTIEQLQHELDLLTLGKEAALDKLRASKKYSQEQRDQLASLEKMIKLEEERKEAEEEAAHKAEEIANTAEAKIETLKHEINLLRGYSSDQLDLIDLTKLGLAKDKIQEIQDLLDRRNSLTDDKALSDQAKSLRDQLKTKQDILREELAQIDLLQRKGKLSIEDAKQLRDLAAERAAEEQKARFESLSSLFTRIQSSAASPKDDLIATQTAANTAATSSAAQRTAAGVDKLKATMDQAVALLSDIRQNSIARFA